MTGAGKSTFISLCTNEPVVIGHTLLSCTSDPAMYSFKRKGQVVRLIDTPGFDDSRKPDVQILMDLAWYLTCTYKTEPRLLLSGAIYLQPIHEPRFQGTARRNLTVFKLLMGEHALHSVVLATTMWSKADETEGLMRQRQLENTKEFWEDMIEQGSTVFRHDNTSESAFKIIDHIIDKRAKLVLSIQKQMVDGGMRLDKTDAGKAVQGKVLEEQEKARIRLEENERELNEELEAEREQGIQELLEEKEKYESMLRQKSSEIEELGVRVDQLCKDKQAQAQREEEQLAEYYEKLDKSLEGMDLQLQTLQRQKSEDQNILQQPPAEYDDKMLQAIATRLAESDIKMSQMLQQMEEWRAEKDMLKQQEKRRFSKRAMQFGGVGAVFGGIAAGAAVLCTVM